MAGDHACPVCGARFTRPQHVTRHMRSHTGDRPYKCTQCGDQFARSDLLSRHVNKCHNGAGGTSTGRGNRRNTTATATATATANALAAQSADLPCDQCLQTRQQCDLTAPCGKCLLRKTPCTYAAKASRAGGATGANHSARRVSLPSLTQQHPQQQQPLFAHGPQQTLTQQPFNGQLPGLMSAFDLAPFSYEQNRSIAQPSLGGAAAQPVPMPNGQYIGSEDNYPLFAPSDHDVGLRLTNGYNSLQNGSVGLSSSLPRLGSLSYAGQPNPQAQQLGRSNQMDQPFQFGGTDPSTNALPPLTVGDAYSTDPKIAAATYLQQRRGSLHNPQTHHRVYSTGSEPYNSSPQQQYQYPNGSFPSSYQQQPQQGSPVSLNGRQFDGKRINERLGGSGRAFNHNDDASSVSDFGTNSGAPSPVPSIQSIPFSSSSRPTSSAGSLRDGQGNDSFVSSLQGAIPLPTPLQLGSFNAFQEGQAVGGNDRTPGVNGTVGAGGKPHYPAYPNFEHLSLDEVASFAAAAENANGAYSFDGPGLQHATNNPAAQYYPGAGNTHSTFQPPLSAGGKEKAINELKEFWSAFISEPLTGGGNGSGTVSANNSGGHGLTKQLSMPSLKTPLPMSSERSSILGMEMNHPTPRALYPNGQHSILGMMFTKPDDSTPTVNGHKKIEGGDKISREEKAQQDEDTENLRSYQEACLKRETPMLRLGPRPKSRLVSSTSPQTNNVPPLPTLGGDVDMRLPPMDVKSGMSAVKFAAPFPPGSKEARDWNHYRAQAVAATDLHQHTAGAAAATAQRPSYKRLPSQTLGPDYSKKPRDGPDSDGDGSDGDDMAYSYPQPGYVSGGVSAAGGAHGAWMRQRSMSSPGGMRPNFDWQSFSGR